MTRGRRGPAQRGRSSNARTAAGLALRRLPALVVLLLVDLVRRLLIPLHGARERRAVASRARAPDPATLQAIRHQYHLDDPFLTQYWLWLKQALELNFGSSIRTGQSVTAVMRSSGGVTLFLGLYGFCIAMAAGVPLGILAALRRRTLVDRAIVGLSVIGVSAPAFASGIFLLYFFAVLLGWFPVFGPGTGFTDRLWHLALPAIALALTAMALVVKLTRVAVINALDQDFVTFARARGLSSWRVLRIYVLRNALIPVVTAGGLILGYMLSGAVLVEVTFAVPGLGALLVDSVNFKDVPVVQAIVLLVALLIVIVNLLTDIAYVLIDPRIRLAGSRP